MIAKGGYIYIMSNKSRTTLYIGVTSNLIARVQQHRTKSDSQFVRKYRCFDLIYHEFHDTIQGAIEREKALKKWKRAWKEDLIKSLNPQLIDLSGNIEDYN